MPVLARRAPAARPAAACCNLANTTPSRRQPFSTTRPRRAPLPAPPPRAGYAPLPTRRLISLAGPDVPRFLQGIITRNILALRDQPDAAGFYTGILNATGRVLHDVFVYKDGLGLHNGGSSSAQQQPGADNDAYVLEVDAAEVANVMKLIKRFKLRSKFAFRALEPDECALWQAWDDDAAAGSGPLLNDARNGEVSSSSSLVMPDTRAPGLGYRVLGAPPAAVQRADAEAYRVRRYLLGVPEGQAEMPREQVLPLDCNMDLMGGIDFRKGCYVGQELTIRTKHRGVVRKRVLPCVLYRDGEPVPTRLEYKSSLGGEGGSGGEGEMITAEAIQQGLRIGADGKKVGRFASEWIAGVGNVGLAMCRLQVMADLEVPGAGEAPFDPAREHVMEWTPEADGGGGAPRRVKVKAFVPDWIRTRLAEIWPPKPEQ